MTIVGEAATMAEAADLLSKQAGIACVVVGPAPTGPPLRPHPISLEDHPLGEVLDAVSAMFGCVWEPAEGVYAFRPRPADMAQALSALAEMGSGGPGPSDADILAVVAALKPFQSERTAVPLGALPPALQETVRQCVSWYLVREMCRGAHGVVSGLERADQWRQVNHEAFLAQGRVKCSMKGQTRSIDIGTPAPNGAGTWGWSHAWGSSRLAAPIRPGVDGGP